MSETIRALLQNDAFPEGEAWQRRQVQPHEEVIHQGAEANSVFVVLNGTVRVVANVTLEDKREVRPGFSDLEAGAVFGEMSLFDDAPRSVSVLAIEECELAEIDKGALLTFMEAHPEAGYAIMNDLMKTIVERLRKANDRVGSLFAWGLKAHGIDEHI